MSPPVKRHTISYSAHGMFPDAEMHIMVNMIFKSKVAMVFQKGFGRGS